MRRGALNCAPNWMRCFFHLYGVTARDDIRYIYSTFPIVERHETADYGSYRSRDLCLAYMNSLETGQPDAEIVL
jgi:hypothetical protein